MELKQNKSQTKHPGKHFPQSRLLNHGQNNILNSEKGCISLIQEITGQNSVLLISSVPGRDESNGTDKYKH
ncbi:UNVERIFIED_CONTAM: hypothetical protein FKN15_071477 [Acipenser sinensis]